MSETPTDLPEMGQEPTLPPAPGQVLTAQTVRLGVGRTVEMVHQTFGDLLAPAEEDLKEK